jgi:hypothetical protein
MEITLELFGFEFKRKTQVDSSVTSFAPPNDDDGALIVTPTPAGFGAYSTVLDLDGIVRNEADLITKYREVSQQPEVDSAIDEIVNEAITLDEDQDVVDLVLDDVQISDKVKQVLIAEFKEILKKLEFLTQPYDVFRRWYIDGRLYYHVITDPNDPKAGIKALRYLDPRKIRKVREIQRTPIKGAQGEATMTKVINEYYVYNEKGFSTKNTTAGMGTQPGVTSGLKIARDSIVMISSGMTDSNGLLVLSYLQKALREVNQLRTLENAAIIYRLSRAPERRVWYIDVGNLPKMKAEQYVKDIMTKYKNKLVYDAGTGEIRDDRKYMTMLEDFWLPRREGGRGTQVDTLKGGQNLGEMDDVLYFQKQLYRALNVPVTRLDSEAMFDIGRATQISRDEIKFAKFIDRLRTRFTKLFLDLMEKQILLKEIATYDDWIAIKDDIKFRFARDNYFAELKESEILNNRYQLLTEIFPYIGRAVSWRWVRKNVLRQDDEEIETLDKEIAEELLNPQYNTAVLDPDQNGFGESPELPPMPEEGKK